MRALLDLMRDNETAVQDMSSRCHDMLAEAVRTLKILDLQLGDKELIALVAVEYAKPSLPLPQPETGGTTAGGGVGCRFYGVGFRVQGLGVAPRPSTCLLPERR